MLAGGVFLLGIVTVVVLSLMARKYVSKEGLVLMAEEQINSRVHIGEAKLSLFRFPATITLTDVKLSARDREAGKPLADRAPFSGDATAEVREVKLAVSLLALLKQRVEIKEFVFREPRLAVTLHEDGSNSLDDLLRKPGSKKSKPRGGSEGAAPEKKGDDDALNTKSLNIYAHGFLGRLNELRLENASIDLIVEKTGMVVAVRDCLIKLDQIDLDPAAIENTNTARAKIAAHVVIDSVKSKDLRYAVVDFEGPAEAKLFDPETGDLDLDIRGEFELGEGTFLNAQVPLVQKGWTAMQKLDTIGVQIGDLPEKAVPGRSKTIAVRYFRERFTINKPISIWFKDWEVALLEGTWVQTEKSEHQAEVEVIADEKLSEKLRKQIGVGVDYVPKKLRPILMEEVEATWFRDGRLLAEIKTKGELSKPSVDLRNKFPDVKAMAKKAGQRFLEEGAGEFLKGIFGK